MPGGRPPKDPDKRVTRHAMQYPWTECGPGGWRWPVPEPDPNWHDRTQSAWSAWFHGWWAVNYELEDVDALRGVADLFDRVTRDPGNTAVWSQLQRSMKAWGLTPEGRVSNRWLRPKDEPGVESDTLPEAPKKRLRVVGD